MIAALFGFDFVHQIIQRNGFTRILDIYRSLIHFFHCSKDVTIERAHPIESITNHCSKVYHQKRAIKCLYGL